MQINVTKLRAALEIAPRNHKRSHLNSVHYHNKINVFEATDTHCAIRIAEVDTESIGIQRAQSIPDLRSPQWQRWGDPQTISSAANYARWLCQQSEQQTGVFIGRNLEAREAKIAAQFMKDLI